MLLTQAKRLQWRSGRRYDALGGAASVPVEAEGEDIWVAGSPRIARGGTRRRTAGGAPKGARRGEPVGAAAAAKPRPRAGRLPCQKSSYIYDMKRSP